MVRRQLKDKKALAGKAKGGTLWEGKRLERKPCGGSRAPRVRPGCREGHPAAGAPERPAWTWVTSKNNGKKPLKRVQRRATRSDLHFAKITVLLLEEPMETALQEKQEEEGVGGTSEVQARDEAMMLLEMERRGHN